MEKSFNLKLSDVDITNITQRTISIVGGKGSGKTQTLKMFGYMVAAHPEKGHQDDVQKHLALPAYIFDPLDVIHIEGFDRVVVTSKMSVMPEKDTKDVSIASKYASVFNRVKNQKIIFAFRNMLQKEMILFVNDFFKVWQPHDCMILFDEIHEFTPERGMGMEYSEEIERAVRHWRNKNVGFIFTTQRPSFTSKKVLALTDFMILYRITWSTDKDRVKEILGDMVSKQESEKLLQTLQTESFLSGYTINFIP